jgi:hypothetical protein
MAALTGGVFYLLHQILGLGALWSLAVLFSCLVVLITLDSVGEIDALLPRMILSSDFVLSGVIFAAYSATTFTAAVIADNLVTTAFLAASALSLPFVWLVGYVQNGIERRIKNGVWRLVSHLWKLAFMAEMAMITVILVFISHVKVGVLDILIAIGLGSGLLLLMPAFFFLCTALEVPPSQWNKREGERAELPAE